MERIPTLVGFVRVSVMELGGFAAALHEHIVEMVAVADGVVFRNTNYPSVRQTIEIGHGSKGLAL